MTHAHEPRDPREGAWDGETYCLSHGRIDCPCSEEPTVVEVQCMACGRIVNKDAAYFSPIADEWFCSSSPCEPLP